MAENASGFIKKIVGEKVYLSPITASEEEIVKFTNWMNDFDVSDYIIASASIYTALGEKDYLESAARNGERSTNWLNHAERHQLGQSERGTRNLHR